MLFAREAVRIVKNCDRGLENAAEAAGPGQYFEARGHNFSLYGPTLKGLVPSDINFSPKEHFFETRRFNISDHLQMYFETILV